MNQETKEPTRQSGEFFGVTTTRPVAIFMIVVAVCVFGMVSYEQLALNLMPDISYPSLTVRTEYPGTAPEEIETTISRPMEQELGIVNNLVQISSISKAGVSDIILEYTWDTDMNLAVQEAREKLDQVFLPPEAERPLILRYDPTLDPILRLGLSGDMTLFQLRYLAEEEIKRELETLDGVAAVKVRGGLEEEIRVELDERQLTLLGLNIQDVTRRLREENINLAGGNLKEGQTEYLVRTLNEFRNVEEINDLVIAQRQNVEIRVKDVGNVSRTNKEREVITRINGKESVEIEIYKEADANIVNAAQAVKEKVFGTIEQRKFVENLSKQKEQAKKNGKPASETKKGRGRGGAAAQQEMLKRKMTDYLAYSMPANNELVLLSDQSTFIENAVDEVKSTAVMGGILAIIVLYIFLRVIWNTAIIAVAIPISVVATFAPMFIFDVTLNIMSLGGLALGIGMLVDNSIVVLESIHRFREKGFDVSAAAIRGTSEVGGAVFASTLTSIAVFFPIVFVKGVAGQIFGDMALTVVFSLLASLVVALFVVPMLASRHAQKEYLANVWDRFSEKHILRFSIFETFKELNNRRESGEATANLVQPAAVAVMRFFGEIGIKLLSLIAVVLITVLKSVVLIGGFLLTILAGWLPRLRPYVERFRQWSLKPEFRSFDWHARIWDSIFAFRSYDVFVDGWRTFTAKFPQATKIKKAGLALAAPVYGLYSVARFAIQHLFTTFLKVVWSLMIGSAFLLTVLAILAAIPAGLLFAYLLFFINPALDKIYRFYPIAISAALANRGKVITAAALTFALCLFVLLPRVGLVLIPEVHQGEFNVEARFPVGAPVEMTDENLKRLTTIAANDPSVQMVSTVAGTERTAQSKSDEGEHTGKINIRMDGEGDFARREAELIERLRPQYQNIPDVETKIVRPALFSFKTPIEVEIRGYSLQKLKELSKLAEIRIAEIGGIKDVRASIQTGNPEVQILYDRDKLAYFDLNINDVAMLVRNKVQGIVATEYREADRRIDVRVKLDEEDKAGLEELKRLVVNPNQPVPIPLMAVAEIKVREGPSEIRRIEQQRAAVISANISGIDLKTASSRIYSALDQIDFPDDFSFIVTGQNEEMETSINSLALALALAVFLIYVVMASQFESLLHPFVIMFTIPLALIGVILVLFAFGISLSVVVFIGMIMLAGIVVNNAIVLVDYINRLRRSGLEKLDAIAQASEARLRPILMTTATTVLGLLPMALGFGEGSEIRTPMAITVIAGLISSTVLTLIVIPIVYSVVDRSK